MTNKKEFFTSRDDVVPDDISASLDNIELDNDYKYDDIYDEENERIKSSSWRDRIYEQWLGEHGKFEVLLITLLACISWANLIVWLIYKH